MEEKEVEIGKLPINTNHRPIQYPREILRQNSKGGNVGRPRGEPRTLEEIALFQ